jgi:dihydroorotase
MLAEKDRVLMVHAQDEAMMKARREETAPLAHWRQHAVVQTAECEATAVKACNDLAEEYGGRILVCHVSSRAGLRAAAGVRWKPRQLILETSPHYWTLDSAMLQDAKDGRLQVNPSLREPADRDYIRRFGLAAQVDTVGSDHAPHTLEEKGRSYPQSPSGMPGVQTMLPLLLDVAAEGLLPLANVPSLSSEEPARIMGFEKKGMIAAGRDADLALVKIGGPWTIRNADMKYKCGWTPYDGRQVRAKVVRTLLKGRTAYEAKE